jgi:hypothetical protein
MLYELLNHAFSSSPAFKADFMPSFEDENKEHRTRSHPGSRYSVKHSPGGSTDG